MNPVAGIGKDSRAKLAKLLREAKGTISVPEAAVSLGVSAKDAAKTLARWSEQGWLSRVRRGLYVPVPLESGTGNVALEDPWIIADRLFAPCYIGGWSAVEHWDLTEQIFRSVLIMTTKKPRNRQPVMKGQMFVVRTILPSSLFGAKPVWRGQVRVNVSDPTRTVLDMLDAPNLGGGVRPTSDALQIYLKSKSKDLELLIAYAKRLGNGAVFKRLGFLLERFAPEEKATIGACRSCLTTGNAKLDPSLPAERLLTAWRLWLPATWTKDQAHD